MVRLVALTAFALALFAAPSFAANVGFMEVKIANGTEPPLTVGIWYPTNAPAIEHSLGNNTQLVAQGAPIEGHDSPLIVMSHGGGGCTTVTTTRPSPWLMPAS